MAPGCKRGDVLGDKLIVPARCQGEPNAGDVDKLGEIRVGCGAGTGAKPGDADGEGKGERNGDGSRNGCGLLVVRLGRRRPTNDAVGSGDSVLASS